jgi:hypothetical protein
LPWWFLRSYKIMQHDISMSAAKVAPPVVVSVLHEATAGLPTFILWATAIYTVLQIALVVKKLYTK